MAGIVDVGLVNLKAPHSRFPWVEKPFFIYTDQPWHQGVAVWRQGAGMICDYDLQCVYPAPLRVPHDQVSLYGGGGGGSLPLVNWQSFGNVPLDFRTQRPDNFSEIHVKVSQDDSNTAIFDVGADVSTQGVLYQWTRWEQDANAQTDDSSSRFMTFRVGVGVGTDAVFYSCSFSGNGEVELAKSYDGGATWVTIQPMPVGADQFRSAWGMGDTTWDGADPSQPPGDAHQTYYSMIEWRLIAGRLMLRIGSTDTCYVFDEARVDADGNPIWTINWLQIRAFKFVALACSAHPAKWKADGAGYDSQEFPIGFYSTNIGTPYVDAAGVVPFGWDAYVDDPVNGFTYLEGPICAYRLVMTGPNNGTWKGQHYSDYVAAVRAVNLFWFSKVIYNPAAPLVPTPEEIVVHHSFDVDNLQISSDGYLKFNNNRPRSLPTGEVGTWGEWLRAYGQVAGDIALTRTTPSGAWGPLTQVFAGYMNCDVPRVEADPSGSYFYMPIGDRRRQLMANPEFALPWLDGYNFFYALAYLAQLGQVDLSDMGFASYVPTSPFGPGSDLGSPEGPAYYLPVGQVGSALTRFSGLDPWAIMSRLAYSIGYMLYFDAYGRLQARKFEIPAGTKRHFYESDRESLAQPGGGYEGCQDLTVFKSMNDVRNSSSVIGVRVFAPRYDPIVYKFVDNDSISNPNSFNHLGYRAGALWMDSMFGSEDWARFAAQSMFYFLRYPGYNVRFSTWLQPDIYPLDVITVESPKVGTYGVRMMVTDVAHRVNQDSGRSAITARFIPDIWL